MKILKTVAWRTFFIAVFLSIVFLVSKLCTVYDKGVKAEDFSGGLPPIMGLLNAELFVAFVFCATVGVYLIIIALLWHYHEIPLHKVKKFIEIRIPEQAYTHIHSGQFAEFYVNTHPEKIFSGQDALQTGRHR